MNRCSMFMYRKTTFSRYWFFPTWFIEPVQSQSKPQQVIYGYQKTDFKVYVEKQKTKNSQHSIEREQVGRLTLPYLKTYYKTTVTKRVKYWWKIDK